MTLLLVSPVMHLVEGGGHLPAAAACLYYYFQGCAQTLIIGALLVLTWVGIH